MSIKSFVKQMLVEKENRRYEKRLSDKCISYKQWLTEHVEDVFTEIADIEDFVVFVASEGQFAENALHKIAELFQHNPEVMVVYGDEDVRGEEWGSPWYKPDWSPDLLKSRFYFGSLVAVRGSFYEKVIGSGASIDGFTEAASDDGITGNIYRVINLENYAKWMESCVEWAGGFGKACKTIQHIPEILYSCNAEKEQQKFLSLHAEKVTSCKAGKVSVVIPSKDNPEILGKCVEALAECTKMTDTPCKIVVVDNGSTPKNKEKVQALLARISCEGRAQTDYRYEPMEFNFSAMCNLGAKAADGEYLLFLNDDVELCMPEVLEEMVSLAAQEYTGAVGLKLRYPDSGRIQHAGITNLPMGPVHKLQFLNDNDCYYYNANRGKKNVLAVTAACLMVEKRKFFEAGGFSEELRVAFNDVDLCFSLYELGYHNVCINDMFACHHESLSRGADESAEKLNRLLEEREKLYRRHPALEGEDPYYSPYLNRDGLDTRIVPGYFTCRNQIQDCVEKLHPMDFGGYRQDKCLMVRVEDFRDRRAVGYGVVLGDNNACYEKRILLQVSRAQNGAYSLTMEGQYRQDLEENMADQINVALCGYDVRFGQGVVPHGIYRVGMAARNRVTGLKLVNWTSRYVEL